MSLALATAGWTHASTPAWLRRAAAAILALALLTGIASLWAASGIQDAAQTIGRDAEPSVALALRMATTLSDMDASVMAESLTDDGASAGTSGQFHDDLRALASDLVRAAQNITYGEAEAAPLRELEQLLVAYEQAVVESRYIGRGDLWVTSHRLRWASRVNRDMAIPQALALANANASELERRYARYRDMSLIRGAAGFAAFAILAAALLAVQVWLARRMRRLVNPPLALATVLAALGAAAFGTVILTERSDLRAAKSDAYDSLHVLYQSKVEVNALRAAASLWLFDPAARPDAQAGIDAATHALIEVQPDRALLQNALVLEQEGRPADALRAAPRPGGLLGIELGNITFGVAERFPATNSILRLGEAAALVRAIQAQDRPGAHLFAVSRWLSAAPGGGLQAFAALQSALDRTIAVNQQEFDRRITAALDTAWLIPPVTAAVLLLVAGLATAGLWLRLREYR